MCWNGLDCWNVTLKVVSHRFSLKTEALREAQSWIERHREFWEGTLDRLDAYLENLDV